MIFKKQFMIFSLKNMIFSWYDLYIFFQCNGIDDTKLQIFFVIKCIEVSQVTLATHLTHPFIAAWILFYLGFSQQKSLSRA